MSYVSLLVGLSLVLLPACASRKAPQPPQACDEAVKAWAGEAPVQGMPQPDGGVLFVKPGLTEIEIFAIVSNKQSGKLLQEVRSGQQAKKIKAELKQGVCRHPANGYDYMTLEFTVTPPQQKAEAL